MSPDDGESSQPIPALRPGVVLIGEGDDTELRDLQLGQIVKLGDAAARIVQLLDGTRTAEELLTEASNVLGEEVNPLGLVELLQALDRRALLDTPRSRMVASQGLVRADISALNRASQRTRNLEEFMPAEESDAPTVSLAPDTKFTCHSCNRCCSERNVLGPINRDERDAILEGFSNLGQRGDADSGNFIHLPGTGANSVYLLRTQGGFCSYLDRDGMCRIHRDLGIEHKPAICRTFPFRPIRTPTGWDVGVSLGCPTVAAGAGSDPEPEVSQTLVELGGRLPVARQVPLNVELRPGARVAYARYAAWEQATLGALSDKTTEPLAVWLEAIDSFQTLADSVDSSDPESAADTASSSEGSPHEVPTGGVGQGGDSPEESADNILRDLTLWSELLVGLEPTDPVAIRRFRSGAIRVRQRLAQHGDAPSVLAEHARRLERAEFPDAGTSWLTSETLESSPLAMDGEEGGNHSARGVDLDVQRRFLCQSLMEKRAFEYGSVGRGLLALTVFAAILSLDVLEGDELHPSVSDIAYLVSHSQIADIIDTRASIRAAERLPEVHRMLLR